MTNGARMAKGRTKGPPAQLTPHLLAQYSAIGPRRAPNDDVLRPGSSHAKTGQHQGHESHDV